MSCGAFEKDFAAALDSGMGGGESIRAIFEERLVGALRAIDLRAFYSPKNVKAVIDADGYQPHLVAPEMGIRRLIELGLDALHDPVAQCVRAVDRVLQNMVERAVERSSRGGTVDLRRRRSETRSSSVTASRSIRAFLDRLSGKSSTDETVASSTDGLDGDLRGRGASTPRRAAVGSAALAALDRHKREAESMVAALVEMEGSYFDADFSADSARATRTNRTVFATTVRPRVAATFASLDADDAPQSTFDGADAHLRAGRLQRPRVRRRRPRANGQGGSEGGRSCQVLRARRGLLAGFYASLGGISDEDLRGLTRRTRRRRGGGKRVARD